MHSPSVADQLCLEIPNSIAMRFSFYSVLSGLAALAVVNALPSENLQRRDTLYVCPPVGRFGACIIGKSYFPCQQASPVHRRDSLPAKRLCSW
ncbi:hypothetical protein OG21DRAFT_1507663, partial [Imleria badia]